MTKSAIVRIPQVSPLFTKPFWGTSGTSSVRRSACNLQSPSSTDQWERNQRLFSRSIIHRVPDNQTSRHPDTQSHYRFIPSYPPRSPLIFSTCNRLVLRNACAKYAINAQTAERTKKSTKVISNFSTTFPDLPRHANPLPARFSAPLPTLIPPSSHLLPHGFCYEPRLCHNVPHCSRSVTWQTLKYRRFTRSSPTW